MRPARASNINVNGQH